MVIAPELTYSAVIEALEKGRFYATTGPEIYDLKIRDDVATLECSDAVCVTMHMSPKYTRKAYNPDGSELRQARFQIPEDAPYVYFTVLDKQGRKAHTHAFQREAFSR